MLNTESGLADTKLNSFGAGIITPTNNLTIGTGFYPGSNAESVSTEKPLVTAYIHIIRITGKLHSLSEEAGHKLWGAVYRAVAVIT